MIFKPELNNKVDVLRWYDARENACFVICTGVKLDAKQIFSKWVSDDNINGREKLETALNFIESNGSNYNIYTIVSFPYYEGCENEKIKDVEGETIRFQFHTSTYSSNTLGAVATTTISENKPGDYGRELLLMMQKQNEALMQRIELMQNQLEQKQLDDDDDDDDDDDEPQQISGKERLMGALAGIVEKPEFTETVFGLVGMALNKFLTPKDVSRETEEN